MNKILLLGVGIIVIFTTFSFVIMPQKYSVGDTVKDFNLKNIDGNNVSLASHAGAKGAIVVFTCNHCPFSVRYEDRIIGLNKKYSDKGFPVIAINPNDPVKVPEDNFEGMQARAKEKEFTFPYLVDDTQETAKAFGADRTPHVFVVTRSGNTFKLAYVGAIDDNANDLKSVKEKYAEDALDNLIAGKAVAKSSTKSVGCSIKWKNN